MTTPVVKLPEELKSTIAEDLVEAGIAGPDETESEDVQVPKVEDINVTEEIDVGAATAEPESVSEGTLRSEKGHAAPRKKKGLQTPMTFGSVDR